MCGGSSVYDECGICDGSGIADGACDCYGNVLDECGICGGAGEDFDLFLFDGGTEDKLGPDGHILPLDGSAMSRWGDVSESVKSSPLLQGKDGTQYGAPVAVAMPD